MSSVTPVMYADICLENIWKNIHLSDNSFYIQDEGLPKALMYYTDWIIKNVHNEILLQGKKKNLKNCSTSKFLFFLNKFKYFI